MAIDSSAKNVIDNIINSKANEDDVQNTSEQKVSVVQSVFNNITNAFNTVQTNVSADEQSLIQSNIRHDEYVQQQFDAASRTDINDELILAGGKSPTSTYFIPSVGEQVSQSNTGIPQQVSPLLHAYSPRLFGAPPQLTNMCDMRLLSANDNTNIGPVGDFYLTKILRNAAVCNFSVGKATFTGGTASLWGSMRMAYQYAKAMKKYDIYDSSNTTVLNSNALDIVMEENSVDTYNSMMGADDSTTMTTAGNAGLVDLDEDESVADLDSSGISGVLSFIDDIFVKGASTLTAQLKTSLSVNQPFYTFEQDWTTYINNVKMMINSAVIMLGLQNAPVRIGDALYSISMSNDLSAENDTWSNYRYMTPTEGLGTANEKLTDDGEGSQYTSFMIDPSSINESYSNAVGDSQLFGTMKQGESFGTEIAFLTNASVSKADDLIINLADKATNVAQKIMSNLGGGIGRFTAAVAGGFTKSFVGDHTIYPQIYQSSTATSSMTVTTHLVSDSGDPYSYLINILVPLFHLFGMALPRLSKNNASAYQYPPIIQANIPGMWGTRLGMITSLSITKNPKGNDVSINGYPLAVDVSIAITDLQHVLVTSPMNQISCFLNNNTMFDYIAQICGCDKYRVNPSIRLVTKLALAANAVDNLGYNLGQAALSDWHSLGSRLSGLSMLQ